MNPKKPRALCRQCGVETARPTTVYCSNVCQLEFQHDEFIGRWLAGEITGTISDGASDHIRVWLFRRCGEQCEQCGWSQLNPVTKRVPLEIDHIDGDYTNNYCLNLRLLCPNCHSLTPTYKNLNKGKGRAFRRAA